jgi:hypothetical protein
VLEPGTGETSAANGITVWAGFLRTFPRKGAKKAKTAKKNLCAFAFFAPLREKTRLDANLSLCGALCQPVD